MPQPLKLDHAVSSVSLCTAFGWNDSSVTCQSRAHTPKPAQSAPCAFKLVCAHNARPREFKSRHVQAEESRRRRSKEGGEG
eukprot:1300258-Rhodomonas_salina.1